MSSLPTDTFTNADLAVFFPELWAERLNDFYRARLQLGSFFLDMSDDFSAGGDVLNIPNLTQMSANAKVNATAVTLNASTETDTNLTINTWNEVSFVIEDFQAAKLKKSYNLKERYAKNAAYTAAASYEDALIALIDNFSQTTGASTAVLLDSNIRIAINYLEVADVDMTDVAFFFHPSVINTQLLNIDKYVDFDFTTARPVDGGGLSTRTTVGEISSYGLKPRGQLYGIPVYASSRLDYVSGTTGRYGCLAHPEALVHASITPNSNSGMKVRVQEQYLQTYLGTLVTADIMFGVIENRDTSGVTIISS